MDVPDNENQHSDAPNSSDWITESSGENETMDDSDGSNFSFVSSKSEERRIWAFELDDYGEDYYEDDIMKLLNSNEPKDKRKLNNIIAKAVESDESEPLRYLLRKGYKIGRIKRAGETFLQCAFYQGGYNILSDSVKFWVPHINEEVVNMVDSYGLTILHVACYASQSKKLVKKCLDCNANVNAIFRVDVNEKETKGFTPLHFAATNFEGSNFMQLLIDHKADVNLKDSRGRTPLHHACRIFEDPKETVFGVYVNTVQFFLDNNADINARDNKGNTPLLSIFPDCYDTFTFIEYFIDKAPIKQTISKLKLLLENGADVTFSNDHGNTILHLIIKNLEFLRGEHRYNKPTYDFNDSHHAEMIQLILTACPDFDVNVKNRIYETPLSLAMSYLSVDIVRILLDYNADSIPGFWDFQNRRFFDYVNTVPKMEEIVNFLGIIELLVNKDFEIDSYENLSIIEYLIHDCSDCECGYIKVKSELSGSTNMLDIVNYGSPTHFEHVYTKLTTKMSNDSLTSFRTRLILSVIQNLKIRKWAGLYADTSFSENFISNKQLNISLSQDKTVKLDSELDRMKSTNIKESVTLYDLMSKHPHNIYQYLKDVKFDSILKDYLYYKDVVAGHLTKSLVRHYVEKSTFDYLKDLLPSCCPSLCCKIIMDYLTNSDMLNVCRAIVEYDDSDELYFSDE